MTTKSVRRRNARGARRKRRRNTRNKVVAMKTPKKMLTRSVVQESTSERANRQNGARAITRAGAVTARKSDTVKSVASRVTMGEEEEDMVARNAQGMAVVDMKLVVMALIHTAPAVRKLQDMVARNAQGMAVVDRRLVVMALTRTAPVARNLRDTVVTHTTLVVKKAQDTEVNKPPVMAVKRAQATVKRAQATDVRSHLATAAVTRAVNTEAVATTMSSMARGSSSMVEEADMVVVTMRGMATGTRPLGMTNYVH